MRHCTSVVFLICGFACALPAPAASAAEPRPESRDIKRDGFESLFNGRDFTGWESHSPEKWKVDQGAILCTGEKIEWRHDVLACRSKPLPDDFELRYEWREAKNPKITVVGALTIYDRRPIVNHAAGVPNTYLLQVCVEQHTHGGSFVLSTDEIEVPANQENSRNITSNPGKELSRRVGEWNESWIICKGPLIESYVNGQKVKTLTSVARGDVVEDIKNPLIAEWVGVKRHGVHVELEGADGHRLWFRNIMVGALPKDTGHEEPRSH